MSSFSDFTNYPITFDGVVAVDIDFGLLIPEGIADFDISISRGVGGYIYKGLLVKRPSISKIASEFQDNIQDDTVNVEVSNIKDPRDQSRISDSVEGGTLGGSTSGNLVNVMMGERGDDRGDMKVLLYGIVDKTSSISVSKEKVVLNVVSMLKRSKKIPKRKFNLSDYPDADKNIIGEVIPYVFGDWTDKYLIQGYYIGNRKFKICDHGLTDISDVVLRRGDKYTNFVFTKYLTEGEVSLTNYTFKPGDVIYVKVKGYPYEVTFLADNPARIILVLLDELGMSRSFLGNAVILDSYTNHIKMRRYINSEVLIEDLIQQVVSQIGYTLSWRYNFNGQDRVAVFHVVPFIPWYGRLKTEVDSMKKYMDYDIAPELEENLDPVRLYANSITAGEIQVKDATEVEGKGEIEISRDYSWLYNTDSGNTLALRELYRRIMRVNDKNVW